MPRSGLVWPSRVSNVEDAAVATYPAVEEERSFLTRVIGWMCLGLAVTAVIARAIGINLFLFLLRIFGRER